MKLSHMNMFIKIPWCHHKYAALLMKSNSFLHHTMIGLYFFPLFNMFVLNEILPFKLLETVTNLFTYVFKLADRKVHANQLETINITIFNAMKTESNTQKKKSCNQPYDRNVYGSVRYPAITDL